MICASYMQRMGGREVYNSGLKGKIEPFAHILLLGNFIAHPTVMLRTDYLRAHQRIIFAHNFGGSLEVSRLPSVISLAVLLLHVPCIGIPFAI